MFEYRAIWNVQGGGVGYSVFHVREAGLSSISAEAQIFADDLRTGLFSIAGMLPDDVQITFDTEARELNVVTGALESVGSVDAPAAVTGASAAVYSAPSGARVDLITESIVAGRRLRGRTYMVPLYSTAYTTNGSISSGAQSSLEGAFETFRDQAGAYSLAVWSRTHGVLADVASVNVPSEAAILRSRRE